MPGRQQQMGRQLVGNEALGDAFFELGVPGLCAIGLGKPSRISIRNSETVNVGARQGPGYWFTH